MLRVLVVDEWADTTESSAMMLGDWGYEVQIAFNGETAL
jgi:hypothetical protein